jgi:hypothetical protein
MPGQSHRSATAAGAQANVASPTASAPESEAAPSNAQVQASMAGGGLPEDLRAGIENLSGVSMGDVQVFHGSSEPAEVGARAHAQGSDIHLAPGADDALPHEAWHVAQQRQGRVSPNAKVGDNGMNADANLEAEAESMGAKAASLGAAAPASGPVKAGAAASGSAPIQRDRADDLDEGLNLAKGVSQMFESGETAVPGKLATAAGGLKESKTKAINSLAKVIAGGNKTIFTTRKGEVQGLAESVFRLEATHLETKDGGHSLDRHGPDVSDDALKVRLATGVAPDGKMSPTTGLSSKFASHEAYLKSREKATTNLKEAVVATRGELRDALTEFHKLRLAFEKRDTELKNDNTATRRDRVQPMQDAKNAWDLQSAVVKGLVDTIGQDNAAGKCPVKFNPKAVDPKDYILLYQGYDVVVDNGTAIGKGFRGNATSQAQIQPDPNKDAFNAWSTSTEVPGMTITRTGIECPSKTERLFQPALNPASWKVYQHFPVDETPGIKA